MGEEKKNEILDQERALDDGALADSTGGKLCICVLGGGGEADWGEKTCACVLGGGGEFNSEGEKKWGKKGRCICVGGGAGDDNGSILE